MHKSIALAAILVVLGSTNALGLEIIAEADPPFGEVPTTVQFTAEITDGEAASFLWEFGDGESCETQNCEYTYEFPGRYRVKLTVTDTDGREFIELLTVRVEEECLC